MKLRSYLYLTVVLGGLLLPTTALAQVGNNPSVVPTQPSQTISIPEGDVVSDAAAYVKDGTTFNVFVQVAEKSNTMIGRKVLGYDASKKVIYFSNTTYKDLLVSQRREFMSFALQLIKGSNLDPKGKNYLYNFLFDQDSDASKLLSNLSNDVTADIASGREVWMPFTGTVTTILGVISLIVFVFTGLSIILDLAYLTLPPVRISIDENVEGIFGRSVSPEAYLAARTVDKGNSTTYMAQYFKNRTWALALLFLTLGYLTSGLLFQAIGYIVQVLSDALTN